MPKSIIQLTSRHAVTDNRLLHCMARTARDGGFRSEIWGPAQTDSTWKNINLVACPIQGQSIRPNIIKIHFSLLRKARKQKQSVFQFHDPDLVPIGVLLKLFRKKVIYDIHDDYEASFQDRLASRPWLVKWFPKLWFRFEHFCCRFFDGVIVADRHLAAKFSRFSPIILGNYPRLDFTRQADTTNETTFNILYVGGVTRARGLGMALEALKGIENPDLRLHVIGECREEALLAELRSDPRVTLHGRVAWTDLHPHYEKAHLGLALYQPLKSFQYYTGENAVKILEYMAAGVPVLTSNFPGLIQFVEDQGVGRCVPPDSPEAIRGAIEELMKDPPKCHATGQTGRKRFLDEYN